jgi:hypothetical protein
LSSSFLTHLERHCVTVSLRHCVSLCCHQKVELGGSVARLKGVAPTVARFKECKRLQELSFFVLKITNNYFFIAFNWLLLCRRTVSSTWHFSKQQKFLYVSAKVLSCITVCALVKLREQQSLSKQIYYKTFYCCNCCRNVIG